jgi:chloride channel 7
MQRFACRFINRSAHIVQEDFSLSRAYSLFTSMGVRHLVVVNELNRVQGIIARKDLAPEKLNAAHPYTDVLQ